MDGLEGEIRVENTWKGAWRRKINRHCGSSVQKKVAFGGKSKRGEKQSHFPHSSDSEKGGPGGTKKRTQHNKRQKEQLFLLES